MWGVFVLQKDGTGMMWDMGKVELTEAQGRTLREIIDRPRSPWLPNPLAKELAEMGLIRSYPAHTREGLRYFHDATMRGVKVDERR
jgi:hypothetical protein